MNINSCLIRYLTKGNKKELVYKGRIENEDLVIDIEEITRQEGQIITIKIIPKAALEIENFSIQMDKEIREENPLFLNGYQTWTNSREFHLNESIPKLKKIARPIMSPYGDYQFYNTSPNKLHSYTYTYIREKNQITLLGSLSEKTGYTIFEYDKLQKRLNIQKDCSGLVIDQEYEALNLFIIEGEENPSFEKYFEAMQLPKPRVNACTGWTSWYNYYTRVSEKIVLDNLNAFQSRKIPIDIFQIDDGYQQALGDWLEVNHKFPKGMKYIADEIKAAGFKAGIWLAPFICDKKSKIYKEHPEWVLQKIGFNPGWNGFFKVLDFYNEEFRAYLREVFHTVLEDWNYDMVKLDFLYAVALIPRKDKTRGQIMYEAMEFLRKIIGDKLILGCGVPLGCTFGLVDYCRIGSDVSLSWEDPLLNGLHYRERVSTRNCLESTIGRRHLNGNAFLNDPDVFIIRSTNNKLNSDQRYTLLLINLIFGGLVFTSDNLNEYTEEELNLYQSIFPIKEKTITSVVVSEVVKITFTIDNNEYLVISNLQNNFTVKTSIGIDNSTSSSYSCNSNNINSSNSNSNSSSKSNNESFYNKSLGLLQKNSVITLKPYESVCLIKTDTVNSKILESTNIFML